MWFNGVRDTFKGHHNDVLSVVFSPDGGHIKSGSADDIIRSWDAHGGCTDLHPSVLVKLKVKAIGYLIL